ncbi:hypothetical protein [Tropicimonas isoalkanivorans]|uniref:Uncharacterized protein n=1 Tax=Tropicimonas isoalkanivorans TaxID=441112 RepID=A0A1I1E416_9RHOB|nr:hypothetical protein [Tropicimonas isoalkanivorans]SFB81911.1 hypothetical protein SAMN04488094_101627 [Tropicimonas isoalkanivorans]
MNIPVGSVRIFCLAAMALAATPSLAQQNDPLAYSIAAREDACEGRRIEKAYFVEQRRIAVECEGEAGAFILGSNGAGAAGVLAGGALALLGAFASGGNGGSGATGSTGSTTGTN